MKIWLPSLMTLLILAVAAPGARPSQSDDKATAPQKASFCDLASNPRQYDGQLVVTEAVAANSYRSIVLFDPLCNDRTASGAGSAAQPTFNPPYKLGSALDKEFRKTLDHDGDVRILLVGVVESSHDAYGPENRRFQIDIRNLIAVHKILAPESQALDIGPGSEQR